MKVALLAVAKNEEHYINEWIEHYLNIGVDHIYIADNNDEKDLACHIDERFNQQVTVDNWHKVTNIQHKFYDEKFAQTKNEYDWFCVFDIDEFLDTTNIKDLINNNSSVDVIKVKWALMYNKDIEQYLQEPDYSKSVKERFPDLQKLRTTVKSIFKSSDKVSRISAHYPVFEGEYVEVTLDEPHLLHYKTKSLIEYIENIALQNRASCEPHKYYFLNETPNKMLTSFFNIWDKALNDELKAYSYNEFCKIAKKKFTIYRNETRQNFTYNNVRLNENEYFNIVFYNSNIWHKDEYTFRVLILNGKIIVRTRFEQQIVEIDTSELYINFCDNVLQINGVTIAIPETYLHVTTNVVDKYDYMYIVSNKQPSCTILCCAKKEEKHINEFLEYYHNIGVEHVFLCDNNDSNYIPTIYDAIDTKFQNFVSIYNYNDVQNVGHIFYDNIYKEIKDSFDWILVVDIDEFVEFKDFSNLQEWLSSEHIKDADCVRIFWSNMYNKDYNKVLSDELDSVSSFKEKYPDIVGQSNTRKTIFKSSDKIKRVSVHNPIYYNEDDIVIKSADGQIIRQDTDVDASKEYRTYLRHYIFRTFKEYLKHKIFSGIITSSSENYHCCCESPNKNIKMYFRHYKDLNIDNDVDLQAKIVSKYSEIANEQFAYHKISQRNSFRYKFSKLSETDYINIVFYSSKIWHKLEPTVRLHIKRNVFFFFDGEHFKKYTGDFDTYNISYDEETHKLSVNEHVFDVNLMHSFRNAEHELDTVRILSTVKQSSVAIIACAKMEEIYIKEWLDWHLNVVGFDHIFLCDNNDSDYIYPLIYIVYDYVKAGKVTIVNYNNVHPIQPVCYTDVYDNHKNEYDWFALIDIDEFFCIPKYNNKIKHFLSDVADDVNTIYVNWRMYGDNELIEYDDRPVQERFINHSTITSENGIHHINKPILRGGLDHKVEHQHQGFGAYSGKKIDVLGNKLSRNTVNSKMNDEKDENKLKKYTDQLIETCYLKHFATKTIDEWVKYRLFRGDTLVTTDSEKYPYTISRFWKCNNRSQVKYDFLKTKYNIIYPPQK